MKTEQLLEELTAAAGQLGLEVRLEKGNFRGGRCSKGGEDLIMLNRRHLPEVRLAVLAGALHTLPLDTIYLRPAVRGALEDLWVQQGLPLEEAAADADG